MDFGLWTLLAAASTFAADVDVSKLPPPAARAIDFTADIKPIFEASCFRCHGTERPKSKFSLATREAALKGGDDGIDIIPGDSAKSPLIHYVAGLQPDLQMPPPEKGEPLTREQIALLRAWIDQGVSWEKINLAQYAPQFSFTPAVRWVTVSGNAQKFQEHQWVRRGFSEGLSDFQLAQKLTNGVSVVASGHAMTDDYKITLDARKEDLGFARFGFEQFRHYYDDHGPYYPFRASGFVTATPNLFSLHRDEHLDIGKAFVEFGMTVPDWPRIVVGYEFEFRNGSKSTEQWGPVDQTPAGANVFRRNIFPARELIDEDVHTLRLDISHEVAGIHLEDNMRAEFSDLKSRGVDDVQFPVGQVYPTGFTVTRESHDQLQFMNTLHGEKSVKDWLFVSAGYLFTQFDADATFQQATIDGTGRSAAGSFWTANNIVLIERAHVFNANALAGPWNGFTAAIGVQNEWSETRGFGTPNYRETDPNDPTTFKDLPGLVASDIDRAIVEENLVTRYTAIPATVLFAEARWKQERDGKFEEEIGDHEFVRDTDTRIDWQEYKGGFEVSPFHWSSFNASYKHRLRDTQYDHNQDEGPIGTAGEGYPAFIRSRQTESDIVEARLVLRPASWLKTTLSYQLAQTDYDTVTDPARTIGLRTPGGHIFAGEYDTATYSANWGVTPSRRWYLAATLSYEESRTRTADNGSAIVVPYRGNTWSMLASSTFALSERTDLVGSYSFSRARFAQHNAASGLPLGIDYDRHGVQLSVTHRVSTNITSSVQYGFFKYDEPTAHGFNDYTAHMIFGTLTLRLP